MVRPLNRTGSPSEKWNIEVPYDPAISLLDVYPKELKAESHTYMCTSMFITSSILNKQMMGKKPNVHQQRNGKQNVTYTHTYTYTVEFYLALNEMMEYDMTWMNLESLCYVEEGVHKRAIIGFPLPEVPKTGKS